VEEQNRAEKVIVFHMRRRKGYRHSYGHTHEYTTLKIDKIEYELTKESLERAVTL
jgi:ribosomal protein L21